MGQRLLVVDSDRRFLQEHKATLDASFDVDFRDGTEGSLAHLEKGGYAGVLLCVEASENKGYSLCSAIRRSPVLGDLKIALISARATEEEYARHQSLKGRADLYLHKPIRANALVAALTPLVPLRSVDPDNPLGDLGGVDLGDEWLESLKSELEVEPGPRDPVPEPVPAPVPAVALPEPVQAEAPVPAVALPEPMQAAAPAPAPLPPVPNLLSMTRPLLPLAQQITQRLAPIPKDAGRIELLEARVADLETKLVATSNEVEQRTWELAEQRRQTEADQALVEEKTRLAGDLENMLAAANDELGQLTEELEEARRREEAARGQQLNELEAVRRQEEATRSQLTAELEEARRQEESTRERLTGELEEARQQDELSRSLLSEKTQLTMDLMESNQLLQAQLSEAREDAGRLAAALQDVDQLTRSAQDLQARAEDLERQRDEERRTRAGLEEDLVDLRRQLVAMEQNHERQQMELLAAVDDRDAQLTRQETALNGHKEQIQALEQEKAAASGQVRSRAERLLAITERLAELEQQTHAALALARTEIAE